jgi:hypothetical protein
MGGMQNRLISHPVPDFDISNVEPSSSTIIDSREISRMGSKFNELCILPSGSLGIMIVETFGGDIRNLFSIVTFVFSVNGTNCCIHKVCDPHVATLTWAMLGINAHSQYLRFPYFMI